MPLPYLPFAVADLGYTPEEIAAKAGLVASARFGGNLCSGMLWGWAGDRFGRRPSLLGTTAAQAVCAVLFAYACSWSIGAAAASALFILRLEGAAQAHDPAQLNAVCLTTVSVLCAGWIAVVDAPHFSSFQTLMPEGPALQAAAYLGLVTTALTSYLQSVGQRVIKAENAAIIYAMDPVYAAGFSFFLLDERLGPQGLFGGALLVAAAILNLKLQSDEDVPTAAE